VKKTYKINLQKNSLIVLIIVLILFGIVMIYNATSVLSQDTFGGAYKFVLNQVMWVFIGSFGFYFFYRQSLSSIRKIALPLFIIALFFLIVLAGVKILVSCEEGTDVLFAPCINGARRWFYLNPHPLPSIPVVGVLGFQPGEFAKLALIVYLSVVLEKNLLSTKSSKPSPFIIFAVITGLVALLVLIQPNMSTAVLLFGIGMSMYFASGASLLSLMIAGPIIGLLGFIFMFASEYRRERLFTYLRPIDISSIREGYHIKQILIALGSGGIFGVGLGQSRQKFQYLPEVSADSIFAIVGEELGFVGTALLILLFSILIYKGFSTAKKSPALLGKLLATGVSSWIGIQVFINIAAMTRLIPLTGVPLPLISYGGSSMIFSLMGLGLLAGIEKETI